MARIIGRGEITPSPEGRRVAEGVLVKQPTAPWARDVVSLSVEGQIEMIQQRNKVNVSDLVYINEISSLELRPGVFIQVEDAGTYKVTFKASMSENEPLRIKPIRQLF